jgi:hypothetical protein
MGEAYLNAFSVDAIERQMDSVFDEDTKQIFSNTTIWVHISLALEDECNFTETPTKNIGTTTAAAFSLVEVPTIFKDLDLVSTFRSKFSTMKQTENPGTATAAFPAIKVPSIFRDSESVSTFKSKTSAMKHNQGVRATTDQTGPPSHVSLESVQQSQDPEISGLTDDPKIEKLEKKFELVTTNFIATLHQITAQQEVTEANFQQLFLLLASANLGQTQLGSSSENEPSGTTPRTPHAKDRIKLVANRSLARVPARLITTFAVPSLGCSLNG